MPPRATSPAVVTRLILLGTIAALLVVTTLSVVIYRSAVRDTVADYSTQQLAMLRTAAVGIEGEIEGLSAQLRQFDSLPSVQNLDVPFLGPRVHAAFGDDDDGPVRAIVRIDAEGRRFSWSPGGELTEKGVPGERDAAQLAWFANAAHTGAIRVVRPWWQRDTPANLRALATPVWRTASSGDYPVPSNDFNGVLAVLIDVNRLVEVYLGPALTDLAEAELVVGLAGSDFGIRMGPGGAGTAPAQRDAHDHQETQGTSILEDANGRRLHAWLKLAVADQTWLVASSAQYDRVAAEIQRSAGAQLALSAALLIFVPAAGWLMIRRERRAQYEQRQLERQLAESQKMEAIGKLAGGVAHDFNNMLTAILGYASLIADDQTTSPEFRQQANEIRRAAESAAALTQKLLAFSRRQVLTANQVDLVATLNNVMMLLRRLIGENIAVSMHADDGLWPILADPVQVEQSIINLAINARDAMPDGGRLTITVSNAPMPLGERRPDGDVKPGDYVRIAVTDSGTGMDEATRARMFEPFFTTKPRGQGTGLGLSTVYGFVRQCGGRIDVQTAPGRGTTVELLLPRAVERAEPLAKPPAAPEADPGRETVLVVEDEDAVRSLALRALRGRGYQVLTADSAEEALRVAESHRGVIDLLLTDVVMPGLKGPDLASRLRQSRPRIRVILMSGYAADIVTADDLKDATLLSKPFLPNALVAMVRAVLDGKPASA